MDQQKEKQGSSRAMALLGILVSFMGGYILGAMKSGGQSEALIAEATKARRHTVPVALSPSLGPADALVTIVEFADFQCPSSAKSVPNRKRLMEEFHGQVRWVFKHLPLVSLHPKAMGIAEASMAAHAQGKFWAYHNTIFSNQGRLDRADLERYGEQLGLDMASFRAAITHRTYQKVVQEDMNLAETLKVRSTPNYFINGRHCPTAMSYTKLRKLVKQELAYAKKLVMGGVKRTNLYLMLSKSKKEETKPSPASARAAREGGNP